MMIGEKNIIFALILFLVLPVSAFAAEPAIKTTEAYISVSCVGENTDDKFDFEILNETEPHQEILVGTLQLKDGETDGFQISYDYPGTYHYIVQQNIGDNSNISYDETKYAVDVYVLENDNGKLYPEVVAYKSGDTRKIDTLYFQNVNTSPAASHTKNTKTNDKNMSVYFWMLLGSVLTIIFILVKTQRGNRHET